MLASKLLMGTLLCILSTASMAQDVVSVTPKNMNGWRIWGESSVQGQRSSHLTVLGAADRKSAKGLGAVWMLTGSGEPFGSYSNVTWDAGLRSLKSLVVLNYYNYVSSGSEFDDALARTKSPHCVIHLDLNGDGVWDDALVYLPSDNGRWKPDSWKRWDVTDGRLWSLKDLFGEGKVLRSLGEWNARTKYKNARIINISLTLGGGGPESNNKICAVDFVTLRFGSEGTLSYNFEP